MRTPYARILSPSAGPRRWARPLHRVSSSAVCCARHAVLSCCTLTVGGRPEAQCAHLFSIKSASSHPLKKLLASQICFSPAPAVAAEPASASENPGGGCAARFPLRSRDVSSVEARTSACARPHGSAHAREASASGVLGEGRAGGRAGGRAEKGVLEYSRRAGGRAGGRDLDGLRGEGTLPKL